MSSKCEYNWLYHVPESGIVKLDRPYKRLLKNYSPIVSLIIKANDINIRKLIFEKDLLKLVRADQYEPWVMEELISLQKEARLLIFG